jgi:hypothetical protein
LARRAPHEVQSPRQNTFVVQGLQMRLPTGQLEL